MIGECRDGAARHRNLLSRGIGEFERSDALEWNQRRRGRGLSQAGRRSGARALRGEGQRLASDPFRSDVHSVASLLAPGRFGSLWTRQLYWQMGPCPPAHLRRTREWAWRAGTGAARKLHAGIRDRGRSSQNLEECGRRTPSDNRSQRVMWGGAAPSEATRVELHGLGQRRVRRLCGPRRMVAACGIRPILRTNPE